MHNITHYPLLVFATFFIALWLAALLGRYVLRGQRKPDKDLHENFGIIITAPLTLCALITRFSFSMTTNRYDERKNLEEGEADAKSLECGDKSPLSARATLITTPAQEAQQI